MKNSKTVKMTKNELKNEIELQDYIRNLFVIKRNLLVVHLKEFGRDDYYDTELNKLLDMKNRFGDHCINPFDQI